MKADRETWLEAVSVCDRGLVRAENQDSFLSDPAGGVFVVADGMGGGQGGAEASRLAAGEFRRAVKPADDLVARLESVRTALESANRAIVDSARRSGFRQMGSTAAVLLVGDAPADDGLSVWIGDSRIYRVRGGTLAQLTSDHTVANELFGRGSRAGGGGYSRNLPYAHVLTRALGVDARVRPDARRFRIAPDDRFLVCSDGIHDMLPDETLARILGEAGTPAAAVDALAEAVRKAGAVDNFTATVVFVKGGAR